MTEIIRNNGCPSCQFSSAVKYLEFVLNGMKHSTTLVLTTDLIFCEHNQTQLSQNIPLTGGESRVINRAVLKGNLKGATQNL